MLQVPAKKGRLECIFFNGRVKRMPTAAHLTIAKEPCVTRTHSSSSSAIIIIKQYTIHNSLFVFLFCSDDHYIPIYFFSRN